MIRSDVESYCNDCSQCRYDAEENVYFCRRSYTNIDPNQYSCDDFELGDDLKDKRKGAEV